MIKHKVQLYILDILTQKKYARFRDMRPGKYDTNLYNYHLKVLQREGYVVKTDAGYTLGKKGLVYVDRSSARVDLAYLPPTIMTMLVIQNSDGSVLLSRQEQQPFIDTWTLPARAMTIDEATMERAARRQAKEQLGVEVAKLRHAGDCYVRVTDAAQVMMSTFVHVFRFESDEITPTDTLTWARPHKLTQFELAPAVEEIITRSFFNDPHFFEEYTIELSA